MFRKEDVRFPAEGGIELSAWLFVPERRAARLPAITMAHGYAGTKYHGIEPVAEAFAEAGFVVLLHDHRGFGDSGGEPRADVNPWQQITDWRRAISYLQERPEVDENRIGLWGTSFAGGHAIVLGATDRRLKAVVAQVPTLDGYASGLRRVAPEAVANLEAQFAADDRAQLHGESRPLRRSSAWTLPSPQPTVRRTRSASTFVPCRPASGRTSHRPLDAVGTDVCAWRLHRARVTDAAVDGGGRSRPHRRHRSGAQGIRAGTRT